MVSTLASAKRRRPQQARAEQRQEAFLDAGAALVGEVGYDAVTMSAIAERAGASIGALYDYFPDKRALAMAILDRFGRESDAYWTAYFAQSSIVDGRSFADQVVDGVLHFVHERPAFPALIAASLGFSRSAAARRPLRKTIAKVFQTMDPDLSAERAFLSAQVIVELVKSMIEVLKKVDPWDRPTVTEEFKTMMSNYLAVTLAR